ncbi:MULTISPECIES: alpha/beta hydrolase fold domain-containing protein [Actinosynnema]|uniref:alpha/beta hydrolase fold domain-containing protein n=1 Tax=Actinosynnema TaxID=40566 RepID=UPI0020A3967F|nr:alpha/beta hydrolase fold domain-containing protein [Actinosynnema pretiosum]MCP2094567.1 acetyl esterase [Actinosynnema pretiosum]
MTPGAVGSALDWGDTTVAGRPVRLFRSSGWTGGTLVWAHGGSWTGGSVADWHESCADLAVASGWLVASVGYRLAPAHHHPAALHDVAGVVAWAGEATGRPVAVGGDSAGGTIAAGAALALRGTRAAPVAQVLAYPPLDPDCASPGYATGAFPSAAALRPAWRAYLGPAPVAEPAATPWHAGDLAGSPPSLLVVGEADPVAGDVRAYADRLGAAGVAVRLEVLRGLGHGEFLRPGRSPLRAALAGALREFPRDTTS